MRIAQFIPALAAFLSLTACDAKPAAAKSGETPAAAAASVGVVAADLTKLLTGITDQATAEQAKPQLDSMTAKLDQGLAALKSIAPGAPTGGTAEGTTPTGGTDLGKLAGDLAGKAAAMISPELKDSLSGITAQIDRLMADPAIKGAIGAGLEKLKGMVNIG